MPRYPAVKRIKEPMPKLNEEMPPETEVASRFDRDVFGEDTPTPPAKPQKPSPFAKTKKGPTKTVKKLVTRKEPSKVESGPDVFERLSSGYYDTRYPGNGSRSNLIRAEERAEREFKRDVLLHYNMNRHPQREAIWSKANEIVDRVGVASTFPLVLMVFGDLVEVINLD